MSTSDDFVQWRRFLLDSGGTTWLKVAIVGGMLAFASPQPKFLGGTRPPRPPYNRRPWSWAWRQTPSHTTNPHATKPSLRENSHYSTQLTLINENRINLAKGETAVGSSTKSSFVFGRWQHKTVGLAAISNGMFGFYLPEGQGLLQCVVGPRLISVLAKWHLNPSNALSSGHECDRRQTDRPYYGKCVDIGTIACLARAIPLKSRRTTERIVLSIQHTLEYNTEEGHLAGHSGVLSKELSVLCRAKWLSVNQADALVVLNSETVIIPR